jgi:hypothetical protein
MKHKLNEIEVEIEPDDEEDKVILRVDYSGFTVETKVDSLDAAAFAVALKNAAESVARRRR